MNGYMLTKVLPIVNVIEYDFRYSNDSIKLFLRRKLSGVS